MWAGAFAFATRQSRQSAERFFARHKGRLLVALPQPPQNFLRQFLRTAPTRRLAQSDVRYARADLGEILVRQCRRPIVIAEPGAIFSVEDAPSGVQFLFRHSRMRESRSSQKFLDRLNEPGAGRRVVPQQVDVVVIGMQLVEAVHKSKAGCD